MPQTHRPSRRTFLASTAVAAAVAGGTPLLSACSSGGGGGRNEGATTKKDARKILPAHVPSQVVEPDIPSENGSRPGFTGKAEPYGELPASVPEKMGGGGTVTITSPLWGTPPEKDCAYYRAVDEAIGVRVDWQTQDGNTYGEKLGAVLASSGIPDMVVIPGWEMQGKIRSAIDSRFADLGPYLSGEAVKKYPNLAAIPTPAWRCRSSAASSGACRSPPARWTSSSPTTARASSRTRAGNCPPAPRSSWTSPGRSPRRRPRCGPART